MLRAVFERCYEARDLVEVVGQVGVGHHDVAPARGCEARKVRAAVAAPFFDHDPRASLLGERRGVVFGAVVRDHDLTLNAHASERGKRIFDAGLDVLGLVQARDHHRHQGR